MPDLKGSENLYLVLAFVVPGLIITYVRAQLLTGRLRSVQDNVVPYLALSVLYYGLSFPAVEFVLGLRGPVWAKTAAWLGLIFLGPAAIGLLLGVAAANDVVRRLATRLGLNPVHPVPTAWDYTFGGRHGSTYVLVTLSDGSTVAGVFGTASFASTDPTERDLLLEEIWDVDEAGHWARREEGISVLLPAKEIRYVQLWHSKETRLEDTQEADRRG